MPPILVVDDQAASRDALVELLADEGHPALGAADAASALEVLAAGPVELVLLDVGLPNMSGLELLDQLRRTRSPVELPVIMVTAASDSDAIVGALRRGASDYVPKPVDYPVLLARVRTQLELCRLSRLKDEFLRIASHDLKNPLTAIGFAAETLVEGFPVGSVFTDEARRCAEAVDLSARRMRRIIGDFLDLGALRDGRLALDLEPVDLRKLAEHAVADNAPYAHAKSIRLALAAGGPHLVKADPARIAQVIDNLVSNAVKFSPAGGAVELVVGQGDAGVRLEVRDSGPGVPEAELAGLFALHARGRNRPTGGESSTGLGLALCRQLVELHGGRIGAHNRARGGAVFWFELPLR